jgi:hypothetical protein
MMFDDEMATPAPATDDSAMAPAEEAAPAEAPVESAQPAEEAAPAEAPAEGSDDANEVQA